MKRIVRLIVGAGLLLVGIGVWVVITNINKPRMAYTNKVSVVPKNALTAKEKYKKFVLEGVLTLSYPSDFAIKAGDGLITIANKSESVNEAGLYILINAQKTGTMNNYEKYLTQIQTHFPSNISQSQLIDGIKWTWTLKIQMRKGIVDVSRVHIVKNHKGGVIEIGYGSDDEFIMQQYNDIVNSIEFF
ncbi:MAG: hypothetical protein WCO06_03030 [Candidatus Roizmanbacteria bacterium]